MANRQGVLSDRKFGFWNDAEPISKWSQWPNSAEPLIAVAGGLYIRFLRF
jgi:hypothetical protein